MITPPLSPASAADAATWNNRFGGDAFDVAEVGVKKAKMLASSQNVRVNFSVYGCDEYPWPADTYDGVAAIFVQFADPAMRGRMFATIKKTLKPGGYLVLQGYTPKQLEYKTGGPSLASHLYTPEMLQEDFGDFEIVALRAYEDDLSEGAQHKGRSALIGLVARRPLNIRYGPCSARLATFASVTRGFLCLHSFASPRRACGNNSGKSPEKCSERPLRESLLPT